MLLLLIVFTALPRCAHDFEVSFGPNMGDEGSLPPAVLAVVKGKGCCAAILPQTLNAPGISPFVYCCVGLSDQSLRVIGANPMSSCVSKGPRLSLFQRVVMTTVSRQRSSW